VRSAPVPLVFAGALAFVLGLAAVPAPAHAEAWMGATMGAGVEAASRRGDAPTPLGSWGVTFGWIPSRGRFGIGVAGALLGRTSELFESHAAVHSDLMLRFASGDRRVRGGLGLGLRMITLTPAEQPPRTLLGADLAHAELATHLHRWDDEIGLVLDGFASFTIGCYRGRLEEADLRDSPATTVGCADTLASTFVVGVGLAMATRRR
jgi:hypothetical protein